LNAIEVRLPALTQRPDDILPLARHFLPADKALEPAAEQALLAHRWPGNVRELRNTIQRAALLSRGARIGVGDLGLPAAVVQASTQTSDVAEPDRATIETALSRAGGVLAQAAHELGMSRQALYRRLERLGIKRD
jgi:DNA-binding NtrC family response regulator